MRSGANVEYEHDRSQSIEKLVNAVKLKALQRNKRKAEGRPLLDQFRIAAADASAMY